MLVPLSAVALLIGNAGHFKAKQSEEIPLEKCRRASMAGGLDFTWPVSVGGIAFDICLASNPNSQAGTRTYFIPAGMRTFSFDAGVPDNVRDRSIKGQPTWLVCLDGTPINESKEPVPVNKGKPDHWTVAVVGKKSLSVTLFGGACLANPKFSQRPAVGSSALQRPVLTEPGDKAQVTGDFVRLRWQGVDGAISYGLSVVAYNSMEVQGASSPRVWASTVTGTECNFRIADLPRGEYLWSIIAFGSKRPIGSYSKERVFIVDR